MKEFFTKYQVIPGKIRFGDKFKHICDGFLMTANNIDMVEVANRRGHTRVELFLFYDELPENSENNSYKVLGKVSDEAIWVKEGDRFTEDQIALLSDSGDDFILPLTKLFQDWDEDEDEEEDRVIEDGIFKIKCSQCNTYH